MSLKAELETWAAALKAYDEEDFEKALDLFSRIADSSKILTNMGLIYATLGEHEVAIERFRDATKLDQYLAVAYFQCGVSNFLLTRYEMAYKDFEEAYLYLRGNQDINYEQLGLKFRLYSAEILFNKGLSQIYLGRMQEGLGDIEDARRDKATDEHNVIDDAIRDRGNGYTVFSIPIGVLYRPSEKKLKNTVTKDYLGKAKLVAASDPGDAFTTFTGSTRLKQGISPTGIYVDRPDLSSAPATLSRSATTPASSPASFEREEIRRPGLQRSKTTIDVPSNARELTSGRRRSPDEPALTRSNTTIMLGMPSPPTRGLVRGLSIRQAGADPSAGIAAPVALPAKDTRLTEFYEDYLDSYGDSNQPPPLPIRSAGGSGVAGWARTNANIGYSLSRSSSRSVPPSSYSPSSFGAGGGSLRRNGTKRAIPRAPSGTQSGYEEEEGYASGDYDDAPFELAKIRVKLHYRGDVRGMTLSPTIRFEEFMGKITSKFGKDINGLGLKFMDEDGGKVTLRDESDYELAIETAREGLQGKNEGKLEIWCMDI